MQNKALVFVVVSLVILAAISIVFLAPGNSARRALAAKTAECSDHIDNDGDGYCDAATKKGYCIDGSKLGDPKCKNKNDMETKCVPTNNGVEICDGIDNNCDGQIDEDLYDTRSCGYDVGECNPGTQTRKCYEGEWGEWGVCEGAIDPQPEICNGLDDNCNGIIDDNCINFTSVGEKITGKISGVGGKPSTGGGTSQTTSFSDSDRGINFGKAGYVYGVRNSQKYKLSDFCEGTYLTEYYCNTNSITKINSPFTLIKFNCPNGCLNGACLNVKNCIDGTYYETCSKTQPLYCSNGNLINKCSYCGCPLSNQRCTSAETCSNAIILSDVIINGTSGNDTFSVHNGYLWLNGVSVTAINPDEIITINGLDGNDVFITAGSGTQIINGGNGIDTYWVDSTDIINDISPEENSGSTVHTISQYYQPWTTLRYEADYVQLDSNGENLRDPSGTDSIINYKTTPLFSANGINYYDIKQGKLLDCYYMASLATGAQEIPQLIRQAIVEIGDGNYIVRMYKSGQPIYLKLDADLENSESSFKFAGINNGLWVALLEKAFAHVRYGSNDYGSINLGWMYEAYSTVFNKGYTEYIPSSYSDSGLYSIMNNALINNKLSTDASQQFGCAGGIISNNHAYAVIDSSYDGVNYFTTVYNPYGYDYSANNDSNPNDGLSKLSNTFYKSCFRALQISN